MARILRYKNSYGVKDKLFGMAGKFAVLDYRDSRKLKPGCLSKILKRKITLHSKHALAWRKRGKSYGDPK
jgi:hypothetical protein